MGKSIIGFHYSIGGDKTGIGDFITKLNQKGIPVMLKGADDAGLCFEGQETGHRHGVTNWLIYRLSTTGQNDGHDYDAPDYTRSPAAAAAEHWAMTVAKWPRELDKSVVWMEPINEPRAKASAEDIQFNNMHPTDWLGWFMLEYAKIATGHGYKVCGPALNSGEPEVVGTNDYALPGMLAYLRYCAERPHQAALAVHEYVWRRWKDQEDWADWYPRLWGRVEAAVAAADHHGIPRTFPIFVTEWGFAHREAPRWREAEPHLTAYNEWAARWPQVKGVAAWTLQGGWGSVDKDLVNWLKPLTDYACNRDFPAGDQPAATHAMFGGTVSDTTLPADDGAVSESPAAGTPVDTRAMPAGDELSTDTTPATDATGNGAVETILHHDFALFDRRGEWQDHGNVQFPTGWTEWQGTGDSPLGDGQPWNRLAEPEGVHLSEEMLPPEERDAFMNDVQREGVNGFTYHLFANGPWHDRQWRRMRLAPGTYELTLWLYGDWATGGRFANKTREGLEDRHALAELYIGDDGREAWLEMDLVGDNRLTRTIGIANPGDYDVGWGIYTVWANGQGSNGCFLKGFTVNKVTPEANAGAGAPDATASTPAGTPTTPTGVDGLEFVSFQSTADHDRLPRGTLFNVTWTLRNSGTTTWTRDYHLLYLESSLPDTAGVQRSPLGAPLRLSLPEVTSGRQQVAPGETLLLSLALAAPPTPGTYAGHWRLHSAAGVPFGSTRWVKIIVVG